ncbi:MAG: hypothetical protein MUE90_11575 [Thermoanaerobaculales bacterium]|jgi:hypothetical protein|nr:hypothetical protein [Thermoanaerobaculales bacterium]
MSRKLNLTCPHCQSALVVDVDAGVVVSHAPPVRTAEKTDFETRLRQIESDKSRAAERMAEAMRKEQSRDRLLEDRFRELLDGAKSSKDEGTPIRDIDLD